MDAFSDNRYFKGDTSRMLARAEGMSYYTPREGDPRRHGRPVVLLRRPCRVEIKEAIQKQAAILDFAPTFQLGHPIASRAASRIAEMTPEGMDRVSSPIPGPSAPKPRSRSRSPTTGRAARAAGCA